MLIVSACVLCQFMLVRDVVMRSFFFKQKTADDVGQ